ncbi:Retrovirus-related Pol polyprotein from transposon TNT 1-94, partial [Trichinella patagoniensis]
MASLKKKSVFELVEPPDGCNVISSKWIFKAKRDASGKIHSYKARLVACGFSQRLGEEYDETFAPVVKHETIRTLLSIAAVKSLHVQHFDVKCAYLNAELPEKLYMEQPPGFEDTNKDM